MSDDEVKAEFLRLTGVADHPFSRTPAPCCGVDPMMHLGSGRIPWVLPPIDEMRRLVAEAKPESPA